MASARQANRGDEASVRLALIRIATVSGRPGGCWPVTSVGVRFMFGGASDTGPHRSENEDRWFADDDLAVVADGLGGHAFGAVAAETAVGVLIEAERPDTLPEFIALVGTANTQTLDASRNNPEQSGKYLAQFGMATTLCALARLGRDTGNPSLGVVNVGDSRLYVLEPDGMSQLTVDHTIAENLVRDGILTRDEAATHPERHALTRVVGYEPEVLVDAWELRAVAGLRFLLCSDGVTNEVPEDEMADLLKSARSPAEAAQLLVEAAIQPERGYDNATAVVVDIDDSTTPRDDDGGSDGSDLVLQLLQAVPA